MNHIGLLTIFTIALHNRLICIEGIPTTTATTTTTTITSILYTNISINRMNLYDPASNSEKIIAKAITTGILKNTSHKTSYGCNNEVGKCGSNLLSDPCNSFNNDDEFTSPRYSDEYPTCCDCVKQIEAEPGQKVQIQFRDIFEMEDPEDGICKFDYLEIRDGGYGHSPIMNTFCGNTAPFPYLQSTGRFLWLRFHSDDSIGYRGFHAIITFVQSKSIPQEIGDCSGTFTSIDGHINTTNINKDIWTKALTDNSAIDCTWKVEAGDGLKIYLQFTSADLYLERPNQCDHNFIQVYRSKIEFEGKDPNLREPRKYCGSKITNIKSTDNMLAVRFFSYVQSKNDDKRSRFFANYTLQREIKTGEKCKKSEFDCKDSSCIDLSQQCNGLINCANPVDEEKCQDLSKTVTADILVIAFIGCLLIAGMCGGLVLNIYRKLQQDRQDLMELREKVLSSQSLQKLRESNTEIQKVSLDQLCTSPPVSSHESGESNHTVIEKSKEPNKDLQLVILPFRPNGDLKLFRETVEVSPNNPITYTPPPSYPRTVTPKSVRVQRLNKKLPEDNVIVGHRKLSSDAAKPTTPELCIEVRDCACQTRESILAKRPLRKAPLARGEAIEFYDLSSSTPIRRVARMLPRSSGADILAIYPAASSASSEIGASLERLDEFQE